MDCAKYQLHSDVLQSVKKMKLKRLLQQQQKQPKKTSNATFSYYKKHKLERSEFPLTAIWAEHLQWELKVIWRKRGLKWEQNKKTITWL